MAPECSPALIPAYRGRQSLDRSPGTVTAGHEVLGEASRRADQELGGVVRS
jgi:hypothetical protein